MKRLLLPIFSLLASSVSWGQTLLHYWNFNNTSTITEHLSAQVSIIPGSGIEHLSGGISAIDLTGGTGQNFNVLNLNARNGDASGNHLRFNDPIGGALVYSLPTLGFKDITVKYATRRSGSGAGSQYVSYSINGTDFIPFDTIAPNNGDPALVTLDFSAISTVKNNAAFKIKFMFDQGSGGTVGNNRFDNFTVEGNSDGADLLPPTLAFMPTASATNVAVTVQPTITFSEDIRLVNNEAINDSTAKTLVELKDDSGTAVEFTASYTDRKITIIPVSNLSNGKTYTLSLKANVVEDLSNNAVTTVISSSFSTIPTQTIFEPGDLLFLGYQMNAVPNIDKIAFVTLVDILPGTMIHFTDSKYVSTAPKQCPGGFTWTAPSGGLDSGSVVIIENDGLIASKGILTGSGFGLSAGGDQILVYTGDHATAQHITALSSNAWLTENTSCSGSNSMLPASLKDSISSINLSTALGNVSGNTANAFFNGILKGTKNEIKAAALNPSNWIGTASGSNAQVWPNWESGVIIPKEAKVKFEKAYIAVNEDSASVTINLILENITDGNVNIVVKGAPFSTAASSDINYTGEKLIFTGANTAQSKHSITIPIVNDSEAEQDEYLVLSLENEMGVKVEGSKYMTIFINDNDRKAPVANKDIELQYINSFKPSITASTCEIVVYDAASQRLFITSAVQDRLDIADFRDPANISIIKSIDMKPYGGITSVAVKNGIVAVASPNANEQLNGSVVLFDINGDFQKQLTVGALPDMVTFSPNGKYILTANEGQPNDAYTIDPEGSISIIDVSTDVSTLTQNNVTTLLFDSFNAQEASLIASGVRKLKLSSTLSQDLEPEFITVSLDSKKAWMVLQENNAMAEINLETKTISSLWALGSKDFSVAGNGMDASDNNGNVHLSNWPVKAFFMPDGMGNYSVNGTTYLVTANEGDEKEYAGLIERTTVGAATTKLDSTVFPHAAVLKENHNLGRLRISNLNGDTDNDGDFDELYMVGPRSFSIWNADNHTLVYDSGDDFELFTSKDSSTASIFNADHESNTIKTRSRAKGPEPEGMTLAHIGDRTFAFIGLERVGGVMVYDVTDPMQVKFVDYKNSRSLTEYKGDHGPEGIIYISGKDSPTSKHYILVANELSGTVSVFEVLKADLVTTLTDDQTKDNEEFKVYPNPSNGLLNFNKVVDAEILNNVGQVVSKVNNTSSLNVSSYNKGLYMIRLADGTMKRFVVE